MTCVLSAVKSVCVCVLQMGVRSAVRCVWSMLQGRYRGSVRVHFSQPFSFQVRSLSLQNLLDLSFYVLHLMVWIVCVCGCVSRRCVSLGGADRMEGVPYIICCFLPS